MIEGRLYQDRPSVCSQAYLCHIFLHSRFPDKQQREEICCQHGIDSNYNYRLIYSKSKYDKAMEARGPAHIAAARDYFSFIAAGRRRF